jgi:hypothetical protein
MAHNVKMKLTTNVVSGKDIEVSVSETSGKLGTLLISKGNVEWRAAGRSLKKHQLTWRKFAGLMESEGKPVKKKTAKKR